MSATDTDSPLKVYVLPAYQRLFVSMFASFNLPKKQVEIQVDPGSGANADLILIPHEDLLRFAGSDEYIVLDEYFSEDVWLGISPVVRSLVTTERGFTAVPLYRREGCPPTYDFMAISKFASPQHQIAASKMMQELCTAPMQYEAFRRSRGQFESKNALDSRSLVVVLSTP